MTSFFNSWLNGKKKKIRRDYPGRNARKRRLFLESLEDRRVLAFYSVTSLLDNAGSVTTAGHAGTQVDPYPATTLRAAIAAANANVDADTIVFDAGLTSGGPATLNLSLTGNNTAEPSAFGITTNITIQGPTDSNGITLNNIGNQRLFYVGPAGSLTLDSLTLSGGVARGGNGGGGGAGLGGAVFNEGTLSILNSTLSGNLALGGNGLISGRGGSSFFQFPCCFNNGIPAGPLVDHPATPGEAGPDGGNVNGGSGGAGGAIGGAGGFGLDGLSIGSGGGGGGGGGGRDLNGAAAGIGGAGGNAGFGGGGGGGGGPGGQYSGHVGGVGGVGGSGGFGGGNGANALPANGGGVGGVGGGGAGMGGAVFNNAGTVVITNSTLANNTAQGGLGGNPGSGLGGALFSRNGSLTLLNSTISANTAAEGGRSVYVLGDGTAATADIKNTIIGQSGIDEIAADLTVNMINIGGSATVTGASNLVRSIELIGFSDNQMSSLTSDPALTAFANHGGPTKTFGLLANSPAIGAGTDASAAGLTYDQRGFPRISPARVDIGALEYAPAAHFVVRTTGDSQHSVTVRGHAGTLADPFEATTLRAAIVAATGNAGDDVIVIDPSLTSSTGPVPINLSTVGDTMAGPSVFGITSKVTIEGPTSNHGISLVNSGDQRLFYVSATGSLTLDSLTLNGGIAKGGNGGGGGAGLGGAVFNAGTLELRSSTLSGNTAVGGVGGSGGAGGGTYGGAGGAAGFFDGGGVNRGTGGRGGDGGFGSGGGGGGPGAYNYSGGGRGGAGGDGGFGGGGGGGGGGGDATYGAPEIGGIGGFGGFGAGDGAGGENGIQYPDFDGDGQPGIAGTGGGGAGLGGAVFNNGGSVVITNSTLAGNSAQGGGGANAGSGLGGAIFSRNGSLTISNSTISGNNAAQGGRGVYLLGDGAAATATAEINNTIIGQSDVNVSDFVGATVNSGQVSANGDGNLIRTAINFDGIVLSTADPKLTDLRDHGGPTRTMAPLPGSEAIDAFTATVTLTTDQRGFARQVGDRVDIGAFEATAAAFYLVTTADADAGSVTKAGRAGSQADPYLATTLRAAIAAAVADAAEDTIIFDPSLTAGSPATILVSTVGDTTAGPSGFGIPTYLTIQGPTGDHGITLQGSGSQRLFYVGTTGSLTLNSLTLSGGEAQNGNGGGGVLNRGTFTLVNSTLFGNETVGGEGGAVFNDAGTVTITNSTMTANTAQGAGGVGGAIYSRDGSLSLLNDTISGNTADQGGRGVYIAGINTASTATITNTIIGQGDTAVSDLYVHSITAAATVSGTANLIRTTTVDGGTNNLTATTSADPLLGALADNVGPTPTMALLAGSPAIEHGDNAAVAGLSSDQRGLPRTYNAVVDIGAFEIQSDVSTLAFTGDSRITFGADASVTVNVTSRNQSPQGTVTLTVDGGVPIGPQAISLTGSTTFVLSGLTAGDHALVAVFTPDPLENVLSGTAESVLAVVRATPTVVVNAPGGPSNGTPYEANATVAGVDGVVADNLEGVAPTLTYFVGSFSNVSELTGLNGSAAPSNAGNYTVRANFVGSANYLPQTTLKTFKIIAQGTLTGSSDAVAAGGLEGLNSTVLSNAVFSYSEASADLSTFTATIHWGDGEESPATITGAAGSFTVSGSHLYAHEGLYDIIISVADNGSETTTVTGSAEVADAPLSDVFNVEFTPIKGQPYYGSVASFTDTNPNAIDPAEYTAEITWGDGSTSAGTIVYNGAPGEFTVTAADDPHTYDENGVQADDFFVTIRHGALAAIDTATVSITVAAVVEAGGLQFITTGSFTEEDGVYTTSDETFVGFAPPENSTDPFTFTPLLKLEGDVTIDTNEETFSNTGEVTDAVSGDSNLLAKNGFEEGTEIETLTGDGIELSGSTILVGKSSFTPRSLSLAQDDDDNSQIHLQGILALTDGLSVIAGDANYVNIDSEGAVLTGTSRGSDVIKGPFIVGGITLSLTDLQVTNNNISLTDNSVEFTLGTNVTDISGNTAVTVEGLGSATFYVSAHIVDAALHDMTLTLLSRTSFVIGGVTVESSDSDPLTLTYSAEDSQFTVTGGATITVPNLNDSFEVTAEGVVSEGELQSLKLTVTTNQSFTIAGVTITTAAADPMTLSYASEDNEFAFTGAGTLAIQGVQDPFEVDFSGKIKDAVLEELDLSVATNQSFIVAGVVVETSTDAPFTFHYQSSDDEEFTISGAATIAVQGLGNPFNVTAGGTVVNGELQSLDLSVGTDQSFRIAGVSVTTSTAMPLTFSYSVADDHTFTMSGGAVFTVPELGSPFDVSAEGGVSGGILQNLDLSVTAAKTFVVNRASITTSEDVPFTFGYSREDGDQFTLAGFAIITVQGIGNAIEVTAAGEISGGKLQALDLTAATDQSFTVSGVTVAVSAADPFVISYVPGKFTISGDATVTLANVGTVFNVSAEGALGKALQSLTLTVTSDNFSFDLAGVTVSSSSFAFQYKSPGDFTAAGDATIDVPTLGTFETTFVGTVFANALQTLKLTAETSNTAIAMAGVTITPAELEFLYERTDDTFGVSGSANVDFPIFGAYDASVEGLVSDNRLQSMTFQVTATSSSFRLAGVKISPLSLTFDYERQPDDTELYTVEGVASVVFANFGTVGARFTADVENGELTELTFTATSGNSRVGLGGGVTIAPKGLIFVYAKAPDDAETFSVSGVADVIIPGFGTIQVGAAGTVAASGGTNALESLELSATSDNAELTIAGVIIQPRGLTFTYEAPNTFIVGGAASVTLPRLGTIDVEAEGEVTNNRLETLALSLTFTDSPPIWNLAGVTITPLSFDLTYHASPLAFSFSGATHVNIAAPLNIDTDVTVGGSYANGGLQTLSFGFSNASFVTVDATFPFSSGSLSPRIQGNLSGPLTLTYVTANSEFEVSGNEATPLARGHLAVSGFPGLDNAAFDVDFRFGFNGAVVSHATVNIVGTFSTGFDNIFQVSVTNPSFAYATSPDKTLSVSGVAAAKIGDGTRTFAQASAILGDAAANRAGLVWKNGQIDSAYVKNFTATVTVPDVASVTLSNFIFDYQPNASPSSFAAGGRIRAVVLGSAPIDVPVPKINFQGGSIASFNVPNLNASFAGLGVTSSNVSIGFGLDRGTFLPAITVRGAATLSIAGGTIAAQLGEGSTPGLTFASSATPTQARIRLNGELGLQDKFLGKLLTVGLNNVLFDYTFASATFSLTGAANVKSDWLGGVSLAAQLGSGGSPGISIKNGVVQSLDVTVTSGTSFPLFNIFKSTGTMGLTYDNTSGLLKMFGSLNATLTAFPATGSSLAVNFGTRTNPGMIVQSGILQSFNATATGQMTVEGLTLAQVNLGLRYGSQIFSIWGGATASIGSLANLSMTLGNQAAPGMSFNVNTGALSFNGTIGSNLVFGPLTLAGSSTITYGANVFSIGGLLTASIGDLSAFQATVSGALSTAGTLQYLNFSGTSSVALYGVSLGSFAVRGSYADNAVTLNGTAGVALPGFIPDAVCTFLGASNRNLASVTARLYVKSGAPASSYIGFLVGIGGTNYGVDVYGNGSQTYSPAALDAIAHPVAAVATAVVSVVNDIGSFFGIGGPLAGSTIYYDADGDYIQAPTELFTVTSLTDGSFTRVAPVGSATGQLVLFGGMDLSTGLSNPLVMLAPADVGVVTPLTTLVNELVKVFDVSTEQQFVEMSAANKQQLAFAQVNRALGIPTSINPVAQNVLQLALAGNTDAAQAFGVEVKLTTFVTEISGLLSGIPGAPSAQALSTLVFAEVSKLIGETQGTPLDLSDSARVESLIHRSAAAAGLSLDAATASGAATVITVVNRKIQASLMSTPIGLDATNNLVTFAVATGWTTETQVTPAATAGGLTAGTTYYYRAETATTGSFHNSPADAQTGASKVDLTGNELPSLNPLGGPATPSVPYTDFLEAVVKVQIVATRDITPDLGQAAAGTLPVDGIDGLVDRYMDSAVTSQVNAAVVGQLNPYSTLLSLNPFVGHDVGIGQSATFEFSVYLTSPRPGETVTVDYTTLDFTPQELAGTDGAPAANGAVAEVDYTTTSGTLTWLPGDTAAKIISVPVFAAGATAQNKLFKVVLQDATAGGNAANVTVVNMNAVGVIQSSIFSTTTTLAAPDASWQVGVSATFTATVTNQDASPAVGTVTFFDGVELGTAIIVNGVAELNTTALTGGSRTITARYNGGDVPGAQYRSSVSADLPISVELADQTITFSALGDVTYGVDPVLLDAASSSGLSVVYSVVSGPAEVTGDFLKILGAGEIVVQASQPGDGNTLAAVPVSQSFTIMQATLTFIVDDQGIPFGIAPPTLTGRFVGFVGDDDVADVHTQPTLEITTVVGDVGEYVIEATGGASGNYAIEYVSGKVTVSKASTVVTLSPTIPTDIVFGQTVSIGVTVASAQGTGTPTGEVSFFDNGTLLAVRTLSNGSAELEWSTWTVGIHALSVNYGANVTDVDGTITEIGDANFESNDSDPRSLTVAKSASIVTLDIPSNPTSAPALIVTATAAAAAPGSGTPTGTVQFIHGATVIKTVPLTNGSASIAIGAGVASQLTLVFSGDDNFLPQTVLGTLLPGAQVAVDLTSTATVARYGDTITFNANVDPSGPPNGQIQFLDGTTLLPDQNGASSYAAVLGAGDHDIAAVYIGSDGFQAGSPILSVRIEQALPTISVTADSRTYDGTAFVASGLISGVISGVDDTLAASLAGIGLTFSYALLDDTGAVVTDLGASAPIDAGFYLVTVAYAGSANYDSSTEAAAFRIRQAEVAIMVNGYTGPYDRTAHGATGSATGLNGLDLSDSLNLGRTFTNAPGGEVEWSFAGNTNYAPAKGTVTIAISPITADIVVQGYSGVYDGGAHGATGAATGVNGEDLNDLLNLGPSFIDGPGDTVHWVFLGNSNYLADSGTVAVAISKATAALTINGFSGDYDGNAHGAVGSVIGVNGENLNTLLNRGDGFISAPGGVAHWTFAGNRNYEPAAGDVAITIGKAAASINVKGYAGAFDGNAHGAGGSAFGSDGEDLSGLLTFGPTFVNVPGGVVHWTFAGNANHLPASGDVNISISKAQARIDVVGFVGPDTGTPRSATGSAIGVDGEDLRGLLNLGPGFTSVPGGTAFWSFAGNENYESQSGSTEISIKAPIDLTVSTLVSHTTVIAGAGGTGNLTYTFTVTNNGLYNSSGVVVESSTLIPTNGVSINLVTPSAGIFIPSGNSATGDWNIGPLVSGESVTLTITFTILESAPPGADVISTSIGTKSVGVDEILVSKTDDIATASTTVIAPPEFDFGDAPDSYGTTLASNGAQHLKGALFLGASVDTEADGQPSTNADGDGADENGVELPATLFARVGAKISVTASAAGRLDAWIDFNRNGVFDANEQIANGLNMAAGANSFTIDLPAAMVAGPSFARFRISSAGGLQPTGYAPDGEVEDYPVMLEVPAFGSIQVVDDPENPGQGLLLIRGTNYFYETIAVQPTSGQPGKVTASISTGATVPGIDLASFQRIAIFGEGGMDNITIGNAITKPSVIYGDAGFDTINGGGGNDVIYGGADYDMLNGNGGDDTFVNEGGADYINGGAGYDTIVKRGSGTFALSNYLLSAGSDYVSISSIENATLIGGNGPDIFNLTGWTGGVSIQGGGGTNTLIDSADGNFVVQPNSLTRTVGSVVSTINFTEIDIVNLTGGFGNNSFDLSAWTKQAVLSGGFWGTDTVTVAGDVDYQLSDVMLMRPGLGMIRLSGFENAIITGGESANTFNLSKWNQAATLNGAGGNDKLIAAGNVNFTLSDTSLTRNSGGTIMLSSIEEAELIGGAGNNIINASAFSGRVKIDGGAGNDTITGGSGIALLLGGAGNDVINAGSGRSLLIGGLGVDQLTGGSNDDLLIDGQTVHDGSAAALDALLAEWASSNSYLDRVAHLTGTSGGANGSTHVGGSNVIHDTAIDILLGGDGDDLFFAKLDTSAQDSLADKQGGETAH